MVDFHRSNRPIVNNFIQKSTDDHMTRDVKTVARDVTMYQLSELFSVSDFNSYPVEEDGRVVGIVSKFDLLANFLFTPAQMVPPYHDLMRRTVGDVMTPDFIYVGTDTKLTRVLQLMVDHRLRSVPVITANQRIVGMISRQDVIRALQAADEELSYGSPVTRGIFGPPGLD
jgi:CBS domain-containing protein